MAKRLYDVLKDCNKEEEVKSEFCKFFKMKINALKSIDHYTPTILFEFKYDRNFKNAGTIAHVIAQTMYYARLLKFNLTKYALPPYICVVDKNEAFFVETRLFSKFYSSQTSRYDWDRAPSTPCPKLVADIVAAVSSKPPYHADGRAASMTPPMPYVYDLTVPAEEDQFVTKCREYLLAQMSFLDLLDKKSITEDNFLDVFEYWDSLFGKYVKNGRKSSEYFLADIERGKSMKGENGQVLFNVDGASFIPKTLKPKDYAHFWENYERVGPEAMMQIRQKSDRITEDFRRRFTGEFFTPVEFAAKGLEYLERTIGKEWWKTGEYRFWDMAAGTGNLEFNLPSSALPYCYISTLEEDDAKYCKKIFPAATCFQYNYLEDDIARLAGTMTFGAQWKMPPNLVADLANPKLKWIIFINPPFATANKRDGGLGKTSKDTVSKTTIREWMNQEGFGEASRELYQQFLFRISKEFAGRDAHLCMFSTLKYLNSNNDQKIRDGYFQFDYKRGFIFPIKCFYGSKGNFPVGFLIWNLSKKKHLKDQTIKLDVFNAQVEKIGTKVVPSVERTAMLNKWVPRPKWDGHSVMPMFSSALKQQTENKDQRDHIAPGFLFSVSSCGDDMQHTNYAFMLSSPYANAGAFSVTPENFEKALVLVAAKRLPISTWTNNRDAFYAPVVELPEEFVLDCVVWVVFSGANNTVALKDVSYKSVVYQIRNNLYPFLLDEVKGWTCGNSDLTAQLLVANEDRFLAKWLARHCPAVSSKPPYHADGRAASMTPPLSTEAQNVLSAARSLYRKFYAEIANTNWMDAKIETWDVGYYQICKALKEVGLATEEFAALKQAHDALRDKLLPKVYEYGFLNPDVEYFQ